MMMQPQPPRQADPEIHWTVSLERANMILTILAKQPFEVISPVMDDLRQQAQNQIQQLQQAGAMMSGVNGKGADHDAPMAS
jgi:hypothetical protein